MPIVAIVADDLTGAADTGAGFRCAGFSTIVTWAGPRLDAALSQSRVLNREVTKQTEHSTVAEAQQGLGDSLLCTDVLAIASQTRALDAGQARLRTAHIVTALRVAGVATLYKKVDSTLRGHVGDEIDAALTAWHPRSLAIVALAFPGTGRTTVDGRQRVHGVALERPPMQEILREAGVTAGYAGLPGVRAGALGGVFAECRDRRGSLCRCQCRKTCKISA